MTITSIVTWAPRFLGLAAVLLAATMALDAFSSPDGFRANLDEFLIHMVPAVILGGIVLLAWNNPLSGGILFAILAVAYAWLSREHVSWMLQIGLPVFLLGMLFVLSHFVHRRKQNL